MGSDSRAGDERITEQREPGNADLDLRSTLELVELVNDEDRRVAPAVRDAAAPLAAAIDAIVARLERGGRLVYVGAGTSGHLAAGDAAECVPTFGIAEGRVLAVVAADEAEEDAEIEGAAALARTGLTAEDAVVGVSASGATPYVLGALRAASDAGALTVAVVCAAESPLGAGAEHEVVAVVGPEVIAGSTRMKAGTAQKLVLNTISTVAMIRLGRTYGNLMVGVVAGNEKLRNRARRTVELATEVSGEHADAALAAAGGDARIAIVSLLTGLDAQGAEARLAASGGAVRRAVEPS
jgi:N-acetylmuramic acid 6-phosphate etherase